MNRVVTAVILIMTVGSLSAAEPPKLEEVRPLLAAYCNRCHGPNKKQGGVDLASIEPGQVGAKVKVWKRSRSRVDAGDMPPEDAKQPTPAERETLLKWLSAAGSYVDCDPARRDPGPPQLRRLTRTEYEHTIRDLVGVHFNVADAVGIPEDVPDEGHFDTLAVGLRLSPVLMEKYFAAADAIIDKLYGTEWYADGARKRLFFAKPGPKLSERDAAKEIVTRFVRRAYRRPAAQADVDRILGFYDRARTKGESHDQALRAILKPVLVSPQFLFRIEADRPGSGIAVPVDDHELAVRLSYFLWSTMPDDELFRVAEQGKLTDPTVLVEQTRRMLKDTKARALTEGFGVQWLQLTKLAKARPTTEFFPTFNGQLRDAMAREATTFLDYLRTEDRSLMELLDADYTFVNEALAKHYGLKGVTGDKLQKVSLQPGDHRGGVLGMGAVLAMTSHTFRTSPTQRGKYVLEVILGTPPPPPPPNVGTLPEDKPGKGKQPLTFKEQLAAHATQAGCAGCHKKIDPLGFALDNYNAVGAWREGTKDNPLDVAGVLPTGEKVDGAAGLKAVLLAHKDDFTRNLAGKMLEYALGRELEPADDCTVRDATTALARNGDRFSTLVVEIVTSVPFRQRRTIGK